MLNKNYFFWENSISFKDVWSEYAIVSQPKTFFGMFCPSKYFMLTYVRIKCLHDETVKWRLLHLVTK